MLTFRIIDKWTVDAAGNWIRIPFIREIRRDRPAISPETLIPRKESK
jgi:hypothetical protein